LKKILFVLIISIAIACTRQVPQLPANKANAADSSGVALQLVNEKLITGEDSILDSYVRNKKAGFTKTSSGLWLKVEKKTKGNKLKKLDYCKITYRIFSLSDSLLIEKTDTIIIAKKQIISGIEEALLKMNRGEEATLIVPWYLGYGMKGNGKEIPPYTSILVKIQLHN
jgi:FKBP-type peptidyl-prolyl cis-trans isomerase